RQDAERPWPRRVSVSDDDPHLARTRRAARALAAALGLHVGDGVRAVRERQVAHLPKCERARTDGQPSSSARVFVRLARDECERVSARGRSRWPTSRIGMGGRPPQDRCRRHPDLDRGPYRPAESSARGWLAGYGGPDSRTALRNVSFAVARLAETRR